MNPSDSGRNYTRSILVRMALAALVALVVVSWQREFLADVYLRNQVTYVGWAINGGIVVLFLSGLMRLVQLFFRYAREEAATERFVGNIHRSVEPWEGVPTGSIIGQRYKLEDAAQAQIDVMAHKTSGSTVILP